MELPEGSIILMIAWGLIVFMLWNFYHFGQALRQRTFAVLTLAASCGLLGGIIFLHFHQRPKVPGNRVGLLVFPFGEEADSLSTGKPLQINLQGLAIADMIGERLQSAPHSPFYLIPTDILFEIAQRDSLADLAYVLRLAENANLPAIVVGTYKAGPRANHHDSWQAQIQLFDLRKTEAADAHSGVRLPLSATFPGTREMAGEAARAILHEWSGNKDVASSLVWQDQTPEEMLQAYYAGRWALALNQHEAALRHGRDLWRADSSAAPFINLYARSLMAYLQRKAANKKEWEDSLRLVLRLAKRAAQQDSLHGESARLLGEMYIHLAKWNDAEMAVLQARRRDPTDSKIYLLLGQLHVSRLQALGFRDALELYQRGRWLNPLDFDLGLAAADYLWRADRQNEAIALLEELRRLSPNHLGTLMSLGRIYVIKGDAAKLFEIYERILAVAPNEADAYYNLGIAYYNRGDFDNAVKLFERAIALNNHANARLYLAYINERQGKIDIAIAYLRERIQLSRGDDDEFAAEARNHLYKILLARGEIPPHLQPDSLAQRSKEQNQNELIQNN
jgi:tetratricopeptide (TPR) repeat protein